MVLGWWCPVHGVLLWMLFGWWCTVEKEGQFAPSPAGKLCMTVPIILAAIYTVIRVMLYCIWLSDHAAEVSPTHTSLPFSLIAIFSDRLFLCLILSFVPEM